MSGLNFCSELKWFAKIKSAQELRTQPCPLPPFDLGVLGADSPGKRFQVWAANRLLLCYFWVARKLWPFPPLPLFCKATCVTRAADVTYVLEHNDIFGVPYGPEMKELAGGANFVLGLDGCDQVRQRAIIEKILHPADEAWLRSESQRIAQALVDGSGGVIDVMSDLVTRVATETCARYFGFRVDDPDAFAEWALSLSTLLFADPTGEPAIRTLALNGAARLRAIIDHAIDQSLTEPSRGADTLVDRLVTLSETASGPTRPEIIAILIGMVVGFIPTTTLAAGRIFEELLRRPRQMDAAKQAARAASGRGGGQVTATEEREKLKAILWELARLNPALQPGQWRYARKRARVGGWLWWGHTFKEGDILMVATLSALRDGGAYAWPDQFRTDRKPAPNPDFIFGEGPHSCVGAYLAMAQITEIFLALFAQDDVRPVRGLAGGMVWIGPLPRQLDMQFSRPKGPATQTMITVCAPVRHGVTVDQLNERIGQLGNPARDSSPIARSLSATGVVHFAAMTAIDIGEPGRPKPRLLLEINVDGSLHEAIDLIDEHAGALIAPIFRYAVADKRPLRQILRRYALQYRQLPWRWAWQRQRPIGLDFNGTPEFAVSDIDQQKRLADFSREALAYHVEHNRSVDGRAWGEVAFVRGLITQDRILFRAATASPALAGLLSRGAAFEDFLLRPSSRRPDFPEWVDPGAWTALQQLNDFIVVSPFGRRLAWSAVAILAVLALMNFIYLDATLKGPVGLWAASAIEHFPGDLVALIGLPGAIWRFIAAAPGLCEEFLVGVAIYVAQFLRSLPVELEEVPALIGPDLSRLFILSRHVLDFVAKLVISIVCAVVMGGLLAGVVVGWFIIRLRDQEDADQPDDQTPPEAVIKASGETENPAGYVQNHFMAVTLMKPGWFRRWTLALALAGIRLMVMTRFRKGFVLNMGTIHYAQWFRPSGGNKLVFLANYDGSWESYLEDFVMRAHAGQSAAWSNGVGFPRTEYLINDGAQDGDRFKRWVRRQQQIVPFWYSRFPELTTNEIRTNALIHYGLIRARNDTAARAWLRAFGSTQRPQETLEADEIQSLVFNGLGRLPYGACVVAQLPSDPAACRSWLGDVMAAGPAGSIAPLCFGELPLDLAGRDRAAFVALTASGLRRFEASSAAADDLLATFPGVFKLGMARRGRVLGDADPREWLWSDDKADAVLLIYGRTPRDRDAARQAHVGLLARHCGTELAAIDTAPADPKDPAGDISREHFGFRDGISQPVIRGTQRFALGCHPRDVVEPGEFLFGYPNNLQYFAPSLTIPAERDARLSLPLPIADTKVGADAGASSTFPDFDALDDTYAPRDFGRNGSFLVIRQLTQDVDGFADYTSAVAGRIRQERPLLRGRADGPLEPEWVAAKMMGRWRDGTPLVDLSRWTAPAASPDNDFAFGVDDPNGYACPLGAHIRRANPRDSLAPGDPLEQAITNRHRLLRRGRSYALAKNEAGKPEKGLVFVALCGDLERQFEFIQQTWLGSPSFHGLVRETDPISDHDKPVGAAFTIPAPSGPIVLRDVSSFVSVKAGGYFFLPSRAALRFLAKA